MQAITPFKHWITYMELLAQRHRSRRCPPVGSLCGVDQLDQFQPAMCFVTDQMERQIYAIDSLWGPAIPIQLGIMAALHQVVWWPVPAPTIHFTMPWRLSRKHEWYWQGFGRSCGHLRSTLSANRPIAKRWWKAHDQDWIFDLCSDDHGDVWPRCGGTVFPQVFWDVANWPVHTCRFGNFRI